jgi:AI-2E family transporter
MLTAIELHAPGAFDPDTRWHLGSQAPGGHSTASGAAELHARTHQYIATVFAAGGRFWRNGSTTKCDRLGARLNSSDEPIHGHPELCQRLLHDGVVFFLLVSGDIFLLRLVEILPRFSSKRQVVEISQQIESDISAYLVTITIMNAAVGIAMALAMWLTGVGDPILWGTVAFLLNYVPILGTALGVLIFLFAGLLTIDSLWQALLPAALYLGFHLIEGETVTPMLLARRFTLNPVLVIISLVFWFWMWGIPGAILSVPMLAISKIICDRVRPLAAFGHFLEG